MALKDTLQFGGTSDYLVIPHSASTNLTGAFTLSAWVNLLSSGVGVSRDNTIFGKFYGPGNLRSYFLRSNIFEQLELNVSPNGTAEHIITGNTTLLADTWYYVVAKYTGTELQLFVNGVSDATPVAYSLGVLSTPSVGTAIGDKFGAATGSGVGMEGNIALPMMFTGDVPAESIYSFEQGTSYDSLPLSLKSEVLLAPPCYDTTSPTDDIGPFSNTVTPMGSLSITTPQLNIVGGATIGGDWVLQTTPEDNQWAGIAHGNGLFVAVAQNGTNRVMTSPDGINWTSRSAATANLWRAIAYGNGLFVAVADSGTGNRVMTSPDGINWTSRASAADLRWRAVAYGNGLFVAVSSTGTANRVMTSPDGINWTSRTSAADNAWFGVTYGNGLFVAVADSGTGNRVMTSPDGINWTSRTSAADNDWFAVVRAEGVFVAVARSGTGNRVMTSPDGINWTSQASAADNDWRELAYANGLIVAVSQTGIGDRVMTSGVVECTILGSPARYISGGETTTGTRLLTDDEYRLFIKARIAKNQSKGTIDSIVDMIAFLIGATGFAVSDGPGAAEFSVVFDNGTLTENDRVFIAQSDLIPKPAGVGLNLFEYPVNGAFAYAGAPGDIAGYNVGQYIDLL